MKIKIIPKKVDYSSSELLDLSRMLRRARDEVEDVRRQLRHHSQLEECRRQLQRQEESLMLSTARVMDMSCAVSEIADLYRTAEGKNSDRLEERASGTYVRGEAAVFHASGSVNLQIRNILYR